MKKIYLIFLLLFFTFYCFGTATIQFKNVTFDFGKLEPNIEAKHIFKFVNVGDGTLVINKIDVACGCTGVLLSSKKISAGGSGEIEVTLKTGSKSGKISKSITVNTNDPKHKMIRLVVSGDVIKK